MDTENRKQRKPGWLVKSTMTDNWKNLLCCSFLTQCCIIRKSICFDRRHLMRVIGVSSMSFAKCSGNEGRSEAQASLLSYLGLITWVMDSVRCLFLPALFSICCSQVVISLFISLFTRGVGIISNSEVFKCCFLSAS